jgi:hypothetical protein
MGDNMSNAAASVALFESTTHSSDTMIDYLAYGTAGQIWESTAVAAGLGLWTVGDYAPDVEQGDSVDPGFDDYETSEVFKCSLFG